MILFVLILLFAGPVRSNMDEDEHLETVLAVTQCRASCLDQFSHIVRNEENCMKDSTCFTCWEMCKMVTERYEIWGLICYDVDVCPPGCQLACDFDPSAKNDSLSPPSTLMVRNVYEPHTDRITVEWVPDRDSESEGAVLYTILIKDEGQPWNQIAQTTSHVVHIKRGLLGRNTEIRVIAANATKHVSDSRNSYLGSYIADVSTGYTLKNPGDLWKPHLKNLIENVMGVQATVAWPIKYEGKEPMQYEVSWSVAEDRLEVTGHLHTTNNVAILTLWANSVYSVQVNCFGANKTLRSQSEPLIINTKKFQISDKVEKISAPSCTKGATMIINAFAVLSAFFVCIIILAIFFILRYRRHRSVGNNQCKVEGKPGIVAKSNHMSLFQQKEEAINILEQKLKDFHLV